MPKIISRKLLNELSQKAIQSPRKRLNHNFHDDLADPINRMLNAFEPGTYIQPHKHENPDKREVFIVLRGSLVVVIFDELGIATDFVLLEPANGNHAVEIPPGIWHNVISLETGTVVYEIKDGPYQQISDKNFASWAPKEGDRGCDEYLRKLTDQYYNR
ncbi:MAG TPA: cupin fold metalloprotein, WbuC family [Prolixibacteraceae bacterium]|nr:cupin fold metalloprotein, WbuC family [Prolixibacteraceae bacterium]